MRKKEFEKLWLYLKNTNYKDANIALANCPDNWNLCSIVASATAEGSKPFIHLIMSKEETIKVRDALTKIIRHMR